MSTPIQDLAPLIAAVQLQSVRLAGCTCSSTARSASEIPEPEPKVGWNTRVRDASRGRFFVVAEIQAAVGPKGADQSASAEVRASFELAYSFSEGVEPTAQQMEDFAKFNGVFNAWPYWREIVQALFVRMGFPPLTLPVYRLNLAKQEKTTT